MFSFDHAFQDLFSGCMASVHFPYFWCQKKKKLKKVITYTQDPSVIS